MTETSLQPAAQGNLAKTPLAHLVLYLYQHRSTGTLLLGTTDSDVLESDTAIRVLFQRGRAIAGRFPRPVASLEQGLLPYCAAPAAAFEFHQDDLVGSGPEVLVGMFDPHAFVAQAARSYVRPDAINDVLARFPGTPLRIQLGADIGRLGLTVDENKVVELLRAEPAALEALCAQSELPAETTRTLLYVLIITRIVAPYEPRASPTFSTHIRVRESNDAQEPGARASAPPRATAAAWQNIASRAAAASMRPPSSASGLPPVKIVPGQGNTPRPSMAAPELLDAAGKWKRVEQLCQRNAYEEALPFIRALVAEDAANAKYQGMLGFVLLSRAQDNSVPNEVVDAVNSALRIDDEEIHALYTKALSYKRMGKDREALHYFKRTVTVEPGHIEAAREVRLSGLRNDEKKTKR